MILSITTLSITTLSIITLSIMSNDTQHNNNINDIFSIMTFNPNVQCRMLSVTI
jgi:hypothetical protein